MAFASLTIDLNARLAKFETDLGRVAHLAERHAQQMERAFARVGGALAALGVGISLGALGAGIKNLVGSAAALDDLAEKTGASVEELSKLEQVARIGGHSMEIAETFLIKLNKALHQTGEEGKGARTALAAIGLKADELRTLDPAEAMRRIAVELTKFADSGGKSAAILELTGKSAAQALPFLKDLATEQGIATRVTAEQATQAEELQKSLARLGNQIHGLGQALGLGLVPGFIKFLDMMREGHRLSIDFGTALGQSLSLREPGERIKALNLLLDEAMKKRAEFLAKTGVLPSSAAGRGSDQEIDFLKRRIEFFKFAQRQEALALTEGARGRLDSRDLGPKILPALDFKSAGTEKKTAAQQLIDQLERDIAKLDDLGSKFIEVSARIKQGEFPELSEKEKQSMLDLAARIDVIKDLTKQEKERAEGLEKLGEEISKRGNDEIAKRVEIRKGIIDLLDPIDRYRQKLIEVEEALKQGDITPAMAAAALLHWNEQIEAAQGLDKKVEETFGRMTEFAIQAAHNMESAMADGFFDLMQGKFDNLGDRFKTTIDRMVANLLSSQLLEFLLGDFGKTKNGSVVGTIGGVVGDLIKKLPSFDAGTPFVPRTTLAMVHQGERIVPAAQNRVGGGNTYINMTVVTQDANSFRASDRQITDQLRRVMRGR